MVDYASSKLGLEKMRLPFRQRQDDYLVIAAFASRVVVVLRHIPSPCFERPMADGSKAMQMI